MTVLLEVKVLSDVIQCVGGENRQTLRGTARHVGNEIWSYKPRRNIARKKKKLYCLILFICYILKSAERVTAMDLGIMRWSECLVESNGKQVAIL